MQETVARLPTAVRASLKEPLGPVVTDVDALLTDIDGSIVAIGDIVSAHLFRAGVEPDVAVVDERTERTAIDDTVRATLPLDRDDAVPNEPGTLSAELVTRLTSAIADPDPTIILVDGEEDLAVLPAILAAPDGTLVVYGQPGEGMVRVVVDEPTRERVRSLLEAFEDTDELWRLLD